MNQDHIWSPTMKLRWVERWLGQDKTTSAWIRVLQQLWANQFTGEYEWRDVPTEEEI